MGEHKKRSITDQLIHDLMNKGLIIEAGWLSFKTTCIPVDAGADQIKDMRISFFAGAHNLFHALLTGLAEDAEPTEEDMQKMNKIQKELDDFMTALNMQFKNRMN